MKKNIVLMSGNDAIAYGAKLARPQVIPIYPITPQTQIAEKITELCLSGEMDAELITVESEHSGMSAAIPASLTGARVFTATASQGILLMHEMLHYATGARVPIVMVNVNRSIGSPWGFWADQTDSLSQRDTGWLQFYCETGQECLDTLIQAFKVAEKVSMPTMVCHDAFYISHSMEPVEIPDQELVDRYLPPYKREHYLDPELGESWGNVADRDMYWSHKKDMDKAMAQALEVAVEADDEWKSLTDRSYGIIESYRLEGAEIALVAMGSMVGTAREAVDELRKEGCAIGLLKVKLFRPFPVDAIRKALNEVTRVVVLDRNFSPGMGGILHQEVKAATFGMPIIVNGILAGVGGVNVSINDMMNLVRRALKDEPAVSSIWGEVI